MKVAGPFDDHDLASHILRMVSRNWQDQCELSGATVPQSIRELLETFDTLTEPSHSIRLEMSRRLQSCLATPRSGWSPLIKMKVFPKNVARRSIACFVTSMGVHIPPIILRTARSMIPMEPQRRTSMGRHPMEPLVDLRNLLKESSYGNYPLKSTN